MELIDAPGSQDMKDALANRYVQQIVQLIVDEVEQDFFILVTQFLKKHEQQTSPMFISDLEALKKFNLRQLDKLGQQFDVPLYVEDLCRALKNLYAGSQIAVKYRRGAIVELLAYKYVLLHCRAGECKGNQRFVDSTIRYKSDQIDVAVLSKRLSQIEGYTCKLKSAGIASWDCTDLLKLQEVAEADQYNTHIGAVCFEYSSIIRQKLRHFPSTESIVPYGLDNLSLLKDSPFLR